MMGRLRPSGWKKESYMATVATIIAIILGPILAVRVQRFIEHVAQRKEEKRRLFIALMSTRGRTMSLEHVQALNLIDVVFTDSKDKPVTEAWAELNDHFNSYPKAPTPPATGELPEQQKANVKGGGKTRRAAGRSETAALPEGFCENAWSFTAMEAVEIMTVSAERKGSVLQHGTVVGHSPESAPRGGQQAADPA
jgi:hypothetical protein